MYLRLILALSVMASAIACNNDADKNNDNIEEVGCNLIAGQTWVVAGVSCNGAAASFPYASFTFGTDGTIVRTYGGPDCQASYTSNVNHVTPVITMVGEGSYSCTQSGSPVASCMGTDTSCATAISAENITNTYSICVLRSLVSLRFARTVAIEDVNNNVTFCQTAGEVEELQLIPQPTGIAFLSISDGATYDFGTTPVGTPVNHTFTVTNSGDTDASAVAASGIAVPFLFNGGAYPGVGGNCGTTISAGTSCTLVVTYNPVAGGSFTDTLILAYHNGNSIVETTRAVAGQATALPAALLQISGSDPFSFGTVMAGLTSAPLSLTVINTGDADATAISDFGVIPPFAFTGGSYPGNNGTCGPTLAIAASCTLELDFSPVIPAVATGQILLNYHDGNSQQQAIRILTGTGI